MLGAGGAVQVVIVAPSRELAMQIVRVAHSLLPHASRGAVQQCIGGANPHRQVSASPRRPQMCTLDATKGNIETTQLYFP